MTSWEADDEFEATQCSRFGFQGRVASPEITQLYIGKKIPDDLRKKGAMSPVRYSPFLISEWNWISYCGQFSHMMRESPR